MYQKLPLTLQALMATFAVGLVVWGISDYLSRVSVEDAFQTQLNQELLNRAADDRFRFSRYVYSYREAGKVYASLWNLVDYMERVTWRRNDSGDALYHQAPPSWFAKKSLQRTLLAPRMVLLLDRWGKVREIYRDRPMIPPKGLLPPSRRLLSLSENENYLIPFAEGPYLVSTQPIRNPSGRILGSLVLASPIDQDFLLASQKNPAKGFDVALVTDETIATTSTDGDPLRDSASRILVSSDMRKLPKGTLVSDLPRHLLFSKQEFFEYGASEMSFRFVTLVSTDIVEPLTSKLINNDRMRRAIQAALFIAAFALVMIGLTRRIERLGVRITDFSEETLGSVPMAKGKTGDQLKVLEEQFHELISAVKTRTAALEAVNRELKDFAYVVSHDLKAPLRAISQLSTWLYQDHGDRLDAEGKEQLLLLNGRSQRMHALIDGILQYSRVGRIREKHEQVPLDFLVKEVIDILSIPENIRVVIPEELPTVVCERTRIQQVFQNLLSNAIKFLDKPEGIISIEWSDTNTHWQFSVSDNGPGIAKKYHKKIFQIFQTLIPRDEYESTGVGLTIVKKVVELHGGEVRLKSELGKGATFIFTIAK